MDKDRRMEFTGTGGGFFVLYIAIAIKTVLTLGIYLLFIPGAIQNWRNRHTLFDGQKMIDKQGFMDLIVGYLKELLIMLITFGLYAPWAYAANKADLINNTHLADGRRFRFKGTGTDVVLLGILTIVLIPASLGLAIPWLFARWKEWEWTNTELSDKPCDNIEDESVGWTKLGFQGNVGGLVKTFLVNYLISWLTCGLYGAWAAVNMMRWELESVDYK